MGSKKENYASVFELNGVPKFSQALPLALQHVVAMIVGCVTPAIIIAGVAAGKGDITANDTVHLVQAALLVAAISTIIQICPIAKRIGSGLPMVMGVSFAYLATMQSIAADFNLATIFGAQIVGGCVAIVAGIFVKWIRPLFPPLVTGTVVFTIGLSLYPVAINYMAGGKGSPEYGSVKNWVLALITLAVVTALNYFGKGFFKLASILIGICVGYVIALCMGMINFDSVVSASWFQFPQPMHFGIHFEASTIIAMSILFAINSIQAIGDFSALTTGGLDRQPTDKELSGGITAYGITNIIGAFFGGLPTATFSQNVGIVATTKVVNRCVIGLAACILLVASFVPKFSSVLTTIPQSVLGGATVSVFASITMTGIKLICQQELNYRNTSIIGLAVALGMGLTLVPESMALFPAWVSTIFCKSPVVPAAIIAVLLNTIIPKELGETAKQKE
ncbi:uracil-xanthine permease family protein [Velocimicrobium porci]|uniref:Purine permease n=1 Tax=Velocimicrobium porci TaxID=2606634 RepID=A0A6L5XYX5_9FIRM|nr:nucleobase:cation symporter-2 family protein [Velocimicrobium porci]MSS63904.1 purine permease [Velocimicrobium porci]